MTQTSSSVAAPVDPGPGLSRSPARRALDAIGVQNVSLLIALIALVALVALVAIVGSQDQNFFRWSNLLAVGTAISVFGMVAVAQTVVIILGGLDISVGSLTGLTSVLSAMVFTSTASASAGIGAALAAGLACGVVNGVVIVYGRVNAVVATLATLAAFKGVAQLISDGRAQGYTGGDAVFIFLARGAIRAFRSAPAPDSRSPEARDSSWRSSRRPRWVAPRCGAARERSAARCSQSSSSGCSATV